MAESKPPGEQYTDNYTCRFRVESYTALTFINIVAFLLHCVALCCTAGPISAKLFGAIQHVETGRQKNPATVEGGREGDCYGPYQIKEECWTEASKQDTTLLEGGKTWKNCLGEGSYLYSERVMQVRTTYNNYNIAYSLFY